MNSQAVAVVTGANSGVGWWTAHGLARTGMKVVLACRSAERAAVAMARLREASPDHDLDLEFVKLDLANLASVAEASEELRGRFDHLDLLINNAGIALASYGVTVDGFESHFGANFLGHFALTGHLLPLMETTPGSRIVHIGSHMHRSGRIDFEDPHFTQRRYSPKVAYSQSKLANVMFMVELDRRLRAVGSQTISVGAHPGSALTSIADNYRILSSPKVKAFAHWVVDHAFNTPEEAAEPTLLVSLEPGIEGGDYYGPCQFLEMRGAPAPARFGRRVLIDADLVRLWQMAEEMTGVKVRHF